MNELADVVATGGIKSFEEYKYVCGQLRGLEAACAIIVDLAKNLEHADD